MIRIVLFLMFSLVTSWSRAESPQEPVLDLDMRAFAPLWWSGLPTAQESPETIQQAIDNKDPFQVFHRLYRAMLLHRRDKAALAPLMEKLDYMLDEYQPADRENGAVKWRYGAPHDKIPAGWWSGMDGFQGPLVIYNAGEIMGSDRYKEAALAAARLYMKSPLEGGVLWRRNGTCWISEYAWEGMSEADEYHVLNGHLLGLQSLFLLARKSGEADLMKAYECARDGTEALADAFYMKDDVWSNYQITPPVLVQAHYLLFEATLFESLHYLTKDAMYLEHANRRKAIFARQYPVVLVRDGNRFKAIVSSIGAPHPDNPDNYGFKLSCTTADEVTVEGTHFAQFDTSRPRDTRLTFSLDVNAIPDECTYEMRRAEWGLRLYTQRQFDIVSSDFESLPLEISTSFDAIGRNGSAVTIEPSFKSDPDKDIYSNNEARISLAIDRDVKGGDLIAVVVHSESDFYLQTMMTDKRGRTAVRYQQPFKKDCENLLLINKLGFPNGPDLSDKIESLTLRIFTDPEGEPFTVTPLRLSIIRNPAQLRLLFQQEPHSCYPA